MDSQSRTSATPEDQVANGSHNDGGNDSSGVRMETEDVDDILVRRGGKQE